MLNSKDTISQTNSISNNIYKYYLQNFNELSFDKQFHWASRLYLYYQDSTSKDLVANLKPEFTCNGNVERTVEALWQKSKQNPSHGSKNASELREPFFKKYPNLKTYVLILFRLTFLSTVYSIDSRDFFFKRFREEEVERFADDLSHDEQATAILSTHAINFFYLYERFIKNNDSSLQPERFLMIGKKYKHDNPVHIQLLIYLYTHCIIGESIFYYRQIPDEFKMVYLAMFQELENLVDRYFAYINLDNKFEFLVVGKMLGRQTQLESKIWEEAQKSFSPEGGFIIDKHNHNPQRDNVDLDKSEHRNALCIMAGRQYTPLG